MSFRWKDFEEAGTQKGSSAARSRSAGLPTLSHTVIGGAWREDESICGL
jgi:hypothetical protein